MFYDFFTKRRTLQQLDDLTSRELDDIGVTRMDIERVRRENSLFYRLRRKFFPSVQEVNESYLAKSVDRVDFERREKEVNRAVL
jgi:hypothetical protein